MVNDEDKGLVACVGDLVKRHPELGECRSSIWEAYLLMERAYSAGGKLLIAGNGGSAADSEHMAGELMKRFLLPRPVDGRLAQRLREVDPARGGWLADNLERCLTAIPLVAHEAMTTAFLNDVGGVGVFAQQLLGYGREGDVFLGISTQGNSQNIMHSVVAAKAMGMGVVGLTGAGGGELAELADVAVIVPEDRTYRIQELHLPVYHCWCMMLERRFFADARAGAGR